MTHPTQEDDVKAIRDALAALPPGWNLDAAQAAGEGSAFVGSTLDGEFYPVVTVDTGNYDQSTHALLIARFYAECNPARIARLIAHIDAQAVRLDAAEKLAADRLDQMNADRKQALVWRDQAEAAERDAARWRYAIADGGNQSMNFMDIYADWDGDGDFVAAFDAAIASEKTS